MRALNGDHRCGLGDLRPTVCKTFPIEMSNGVLCIPGETGCACRRWSLADVDLAEEGALAALHRQELAEYCEVVAEWNEHVASAPPDAAFSFVSFCRYLVQAYDSITAAETGQSAESAWA
jgi:hypothetical protein